MTIPDFFESEYFWIYIVMAYIFLMFYLWGILPIRRKKKAKRLLKKRVKFLISLAEGEKDHE